MTNQAKAKLYDQLSKGGHVELREALKNTKVEFRRWHINE
jgi:hypothetical protein